VWTPFGTSTLPFLLVRNSKSNPGPEEAIANLQNKMTTKFQFNLNVTTIHKEKIINMQSKKEQQAMKYWFHYYNTITTSNETMV
jgi:hypothetical protein